MIKNFIVIFDINSRLWEFTKFWYYISVWMWELNYIYIFTVKNMFSPLYSIKSTGEGFGKRLCNIFLIILDEWIWMIHFFLLGAFLVLLVSNVLLWENVASVPLNRNETDELHLKELFDHAMLLYKNISDLNMDLPRIFVSTSLMSVLLTFS